MISKFNIEDIEKLNELLCIFDSSITLNELSNNKFINILVYDDYKGIIVYDYIYDRIEIEYIVVKEQCRNMGIATRLLEHMISKYNNINNITLEVRESNKIAINFYKKNGFNEVARRKNYYKDEDGILMIKK